MRSESEDTRAMFDAALAKHQSGAFVQARALYTRILERDPEHADALHFLGLIAHQTGEQEEAAGLMQKAIARKPSVASYHNNLAKVFEEQGDLNAALGAYREALRLDPNDADGHFNLGVVLQKLRRIDDAEASFRDALSRRSDDPEYYYNLANVLRDQGRLEQAVEIYRESVRLRPGFVEAHQNLGHVLMALGSLDQAIEALRQVLRLQSGCSEARRMMGNAFRFLKPTRYEPMLEDDLKVNFGAPEVNAQYLAKLTANQLRHKHRIDARLESDFDALAADVGTDELLLTMLAKTVNVDPMLERLLTAIRRDLLLKLCDAPDIPPIHTTLIAALGLQCFSNEYVFTAQADEEDTINRLQAHFESLVQTHTTPSPALEASLLLLVMYRPLHTLICAPALASIAVNAWSAPVQPLIVRTLKEPLEERAIEKTIESLGEIADATSQIVQSQYEEHPYPRWLSLRRFRKVGLDVLLCKNYPHFTPPDFFNGPTRTLVAGCGTGQEPIAVALDRENTEIVAVDLSRRSLAYAVRMARKLDIDNIRFLQADILALPRLGEQFHVIDCAGVLHHMGDPLRGWRVLADLLLPGGLMKIGLYSEQARASVVAAREKIRRDGLNPVDTDIKKFRASIVAGKAGPVLAELLGSEDFYSLSECRDLLFHAAEQRFTLPQIAQALEDLSLTFIGFEISAPQVKQRYRECFPKDANMVDLDAWYRFEQLRPETFAGMYVFWCQKSKTSGKSQGASSK